MSLLKAGAARTRAWRLMERGKIKIYKCSVCFCPACFAITLPESPPPSDGYCGGSHHQMRGPSHGYREITGEEGVSRLERWKQAFVLNDTIVRISLHRHRDVVYMSFLIIFFKLYLPFLCRYTSRTSAKCTCYC
jgi:hypothetical protein